MKLNVQIDSDRAQQAFAKAPDVMRRSLERYIDRAAHEVAREARRRAPKAFSTLTNSINVHRGGLYLREHQISRVIAPSVNYAAFVEGGTRPHRPGPRNGLAEWVKLKFGGSAKEQRDRTFLIGRAIAKRGTRAQPFMRPAAEKMESRVIALLREGVDAGIREILG